MQFKDYYQTLGVPRDADAGGHQESLPQAGAQVSPGRFQGSGRRTAHEGGQRGQCRVVRPGKARRLRPARAATTGPARTSARRRTGMPVSNFPGAASRRTRPGISAISSPSCSAAWAVINPGLAKQRRTLPGAWRGPSRQGAAGPGRRLPAAPPGRSACRRRQVDAQGRVYASPHTHAQRDAFRKRRASEGQVIRLAGQGAAGAWCGHRRRSDAGGAFQAACTLSRQTAATCI
jgi:hypothetical protein